MSTDDDGIIDAEVIEDDRLPAVIQPEATNRGHTPIEAERLTPDGRTWPHGPKPERRCVAHKKNGAQCKNASVPGATVCRFHGGAAPHVKRAARARLENAADLMAKQLLGIALTAESESVKLAAIRDALDRGGLKAPAEVVLSQGETKPYETVFDSIGGNPGESLDASSGYGSAGRDASPAPAYGDTEYAGLQPVAEENGEPSPDTGAQREAERQEFDRDSQPGPRHEARPQRTPARPEMHVMGMAAIRIANEANSAAGVFDEQLALESPHKRYRRP
ncbi:HGGxSTG domain-containing protein [Mycobacterium intracellulare]|uniref:HGGxSTG domain-containing protein n=1 Tax=Mycobacterium intracellulare TaxID=1767 RepID=UPI00109E90BF|nr:HGGxSTG domain-containing protein [Mycobacterium intracellulare]